MAGVPGFYSSKTVNHGLKKNLAFFILRCGNLHMHETEVGIIGSFSMKHIFQAAGSCQCNGTDRGTDEIILPILFITICVSMNGKASVQPFPIISILQ